MDSIVTVVTNTVLHTGRAVSTKLQSSHPYNDNDNEDEMLTMCNEDCVN